MPSQSLNEFPQHKAGENARERIPQKYSSTKIVQSKASGTMDLLGMVEFALVSPFHRAQLGPRGIVYKVIPPWQQNTRFDHSPLNSRWWSQAPPLAQHSPTHRQSLDCPFPRLPNRKGWDKSEPWCKNTMQERQRKVGAHNQHTIPVPAYRY